MESDSELMQKVRRIAGHIHRSIPARVDLDDLVQDGMIGLLDAKRRYDPQKSENFMTFASARIDGAIRDGMRSRDWCGRTARILISRVLRATTQLTQQLGREPTSEEAAAEANLSLDEFYKARAMWHSSIPVSLSARIAALAEIDLDGTIEDTIVDDRCADGFEMVVLKEHKTLLHDAFRKLNAKERQAVWLYYLDTNEYTLVEVAQFMGIGASRVSQLCANAKKKLGVELRKHREFDARGESMAASDNREQTKSQRTAGDKRPQPGAAIFHAAPSASSWSTRVGVA